MPETQPDSDPPSPDGPVGDQRHTAGSTQAAEGAAASQPKPAPRRTDTPPSPRRSTAGLVFGVLGFLILAGGISYLWYQQQQFQQNQPDSSAQLTALQQQVQALRQQVARLQEQPAVRIPADLQALTAKVQQLEQQSRPDLGDIKSRLSAVEQRQPVDLQPLQQQIKDLQQKTATEARVAQRVGALAEQVNGAVQQAQESATRSQQADSALTQRLDTDESRLVTLEQNAKQISALAERSTRLARLQAAQMALAQGHELGEIPGAPAALSRYASEAPPTEASLRLAFPKVEQAAYDASAPDTANKPFLSRVLANAEGLVTVRQGDRVLVGNATAGILTRARAALEAGDLAGAVADLSSLSGPPARAVQLWLERAKALLAARSALAQLVAKA